MTPELRDSVQPKCTYVAAGVYISVSLQVPAVPRQPPTASAAAGQQSGLTREVQAGNAAGVIMYYERVLKCPE